MNSGVELFKGVDSFDVLFVPKESDPGFQHRVLVLYSVNRTHRPSRIDVLTCRSWTSGFRYAFRCSGWFRIDMSTCRSWTFGYSDFVPRLVGLSISGSTC